MLNKNQTAEVKARRKKYGTDCSKEPHLTKQAFKDECDINRVLERAQRGAGIAHLAKYGGMYGDFSNWNERTYEEMQEQMARANTIFNDLPAEIRNEFDNHPGKFYEFVNNPENKDRLEEIYPTLAQPGRQFPDVIGGLATTLERLDNTLAAASSNAPTDTGTDASEPTVGT